MAGLIGEEALLMAQKVWQLMSKGKGYEKSLQQVVITAAGQGGCTAEFKVEEGMTNRGGSLHGGCTATLIDCISTIGLMTGKNQSPGVSINLSVSYLKGALEGETIVIDTKTVKSGKTLAFLEAVLKKKESGDIVATGTHIKFIGS
ncbi:hypothetical protein RUM43_005566 [Polyplax serrata]|uniref:Thioesterase domain-containing protein n=1 Tax=Polyplax serrata TaxID=468196 RepID=A0AAN8S4V1_POLSC